MIVNVERVVTKQRINYPHKTLDRWWLVDLTKYTISSFNKAKKRIMIDQLDLLGKKWQKSQHANRFTFGLSIDSSRRLWSGDGSRSNRHKKSDLYLWLSLYIILYTMPNVLNQIEVARAFEMKCWTPVKSGNPSGIGYLARYACAEITTFFDALNFLLLLLWLFLYYQLSFCLDFQESIIGWTACSDLLRNNRTRFLNFFIEPFELKINPCLSSFHNNASLL